MKWTLLLMLAALAATPTVSADWARDNQFPCILLADCPVDPCLGDSPPQVVDTALHCAAVVPDRAPDNAAVLAEWTWAVAENLANTGYNGLDDQYENNQVDLAPVNGPLCSTVWSHFCTNPLTYPGWQDVPDPIGPYPL